MRILSTDNMLSHGLIPVPGQVYAWSRLSVPFPEGWTEIAKVSVYKVAKRDAEGIYPSIEGKLYPFPTDLKRWHEVSRREAGAFEKAGCPIVIEGVMNNIPIPEVAWLCKTTAGTEVSASERITQQILLESLQKPWPLLDFRYWRMR